MQDYKIEITGNVYNKVKELAKDGKSQMLRIAVEGGGCSGFAYDYAMIDQVEDDDVVFASEDLKVVIDRGSCQLIAGSRIDYKNELGGSYFAIDNPQAKGKCGCGNSFSM